MTLTKSRMFALTAAVLLAVLAVARGLGGVLLLVRPDAATSAPPGALLAIAGTGLILVGLLAGAAAGGVVAGRRFYFGLGFVSLALFVLGGLFNGYVVLGAPRVAGVIVNVAFAGVTAILLHLGHPRRSGSVG